jgi:hypothetical protein
MSVRLKKTGCTPIVDIPPWDIRTNPRIGNRYKILREGDVVEVRIGRDRRSQAIVPAGDGTVNGRTFLNAPAFGLACSEIVNQRVHVSYVRIPLPVPLPVKKEMRPPPLGSAPTQVVLKGINSGSGDVGIAVEIKS